MIKVEWQGWHYEGSVTRQITSIIESYKTDRDAKIVCGFGFGPSGGFCNIGLGKQDFLIQDLIGKHNMQEMIEKILAAIADMDKSYAPGKMFKNTTMKDVLVSIVPGQKYYDTNIYIHLKY